MSLRDPVNRQEFEFAARMEDRLGIASTAPYRLTYQLTYASNALAITGDQVIQRYNLVGTAKYTVTSTATGQTLTSGTVSSFTGYSTTGTIVATRAAEKDAYARLMVLLADKVTTDLVASGPRWLP